MPVVKANKKVNNKVVKKQPIFDLSWLDVIKQSPFSTWVSDEEGNMVFMNNAFKKMFGVKNESDLLGKYNIFKDKALQDPDIQKQIREVFSKGKAARFTMNYSLQWAKHVHVPGSKEVFIEVNSFPIKYKNKKIINVAVQNHDITTEKMMEKEIKDSEERYKDLFDNMSSAIAIYRSNATCSKFYFKDFNKKAEEIEGVKREDVLNKEVREVFTGAGKMGVIEVFSKVCKTGVPFSSIEAEYINPNTGAVSYRDNFVYRLSGGDIVVFYRDVSVRVLARKELDKKIEELEKLNKLMVGRELKMIQLKEEINRLRTKN